MRDDVEYENYIHRHEKQNVVQATGNDHQCCRFDTHGDNVGVGRSMFHSKGSSDASSEINESENDQHREYGVYESGD